MGSVCCVVGLIPRLRAALVGCSPHTMEPGPLGCLDSLLLILFQLFIHPSWPFFLFSVSVSAPAFLWLLFHLRRGRGPEHQARSVLASYPSISGWCEIGVPISIF